MPHPRTRKFLSLLVIAPILAIFIAGCPGDHDSTTHVKAPEGGYLFCFWNVENLFDDKDDHEANDADKKFDTWFVNDPQALKLKLANLSKVIIEMNDGRGPDILALAEVENERAAQLLVDALNARLADASLHYKHLLFKDPHGGRHIATTIITRLPVEGDKTQLHGRRLRILEGHVAVNGHDLVVIASHWTSRVSDHDGTGREKYADQIHGVYKAMHLSNPKVDFLVCGDFNDPPDARSVVEHLHAVGSREKVLQPSRDNPLLFDLFAGKNASANGTLYYSGEFSIFDQIAVSPGLLDNQGWTCMPDTAQTVNSIFKPGDKKHRPWPFGNQSDKHDRGTSDHFPVTVRLKVQGN